MVFLKKSTKTPGEAAQAELYFCFAVQVPYELLSPQHLPVGHSLLEHLERGRVFCCSFQRRAETRLRSHRSEKKIVSRSSGRGLAAVHHRQSDPSRHPGKSFSLNSRAESDNALTPGQKTSNLCPVAQYCDRRRPDGEQEPVAGADD